MPLNDSHLKKLLARVADNNTKSAGKNQQSRRGGNNRGQRNNGGGSNGGSNGGGSSQSGNGRQGQSQDDKIKALTKRVHRLEQAQNFMEPMVIMAMRQL